MPKRTDACAIELSREQLERGHNLTEALANELSDAIEQGALGDGDLLPPERWLAGKLRLGRVTVRNAYRRLVQAGLAEARPGMGYRVRRRHTWTPQDLSIA